MCSLKLLFPADRQEPPHAHTHFRLKARRTGLSPARARALRPLLRVARSRTQSERGLPHERTKSAQPLSACPGRASGGGYAINGTRRTQRSDCLGRAAQAVNCATRSRAAGSHVGRSHVSHLFVSLSRSLARTVSERNSRIDARLQQRASRFLLFVVFFSAARRPARPQCPV